MVHTAAVNCPQFNDSISPTRGKAKLLYVSALGVGDQLNRIVGYSIDTHVVSTKFTHKTVAVEGVKDEQLTGRGASEKDPTIRSKTATSNTVVRGKERQ